MPRRITIFCSLAGLAAMLLPATPALAMHIADGYLQGWWPGLWFVVAAPFVAWGLWTIKRRAAGQPRYNALVALVGAAIFVISCMPIPMPTGTCSHPCGTGLGAILIGPGPTIVVASVALLLQAMFLAHGGLSTLGANIFSMGVVGALSAWASWRLLRALRVPIIVAAFVAGLVSDWGTYATTSLVLSAGLPGDMVPMFWVILLAFAPTQVPLGILEGVMTAGAYKFVLTRRPELLDPATGQVGHAKETR